MSGNATDDADIRALAGCAGGEQAALAEIYARHSAACFGLALSMLHDPDAAQGAVQDAYLDLWRHAEAFDSGQSSVRDHLLRLTRSNAIDRVRRDDRRTVAAPPAAGGGARRRCPEAQAIVAALGGGLGDVLTTLPPAKRDPLVLAYWGGYTQREIADLTATPLDTVKRRMLRALRDLKRLLDAPPLDAGPAGAV